MSGKPSVAQEGVYPWQPVEDYVRGRWPLVDIKTTTPQQTPSRFYSSACIEKMARPRMPDLIGISSSRYYEYQHAGMISDRVADRVATSLGIHPVELWPSWFDDALAG